MKKKIVAFAGSNSSKSINKQLVEFVLTHFKDCDIDLLDLNDYEMPIYSIDRELANGIPNEALLFEKFMEESDIIICSLAENNRTYSAAFKNILDWSSRISSNGNVFKNKAMFLMTTSPGGYGGGNVMNVAKTFFPQFGANVIDTFSLPLFDKNFVNGDIVDPTLKDELVDKINKFRTKVL